MTCATIRGPSALTSQECHRKFWPRRSHAKFQESSTPCAIHNLEKATPTPPLGSQDISSHESSTLLRPLWVTTPKVTNLWSALFSSTVSCIPRIPILYVTHCAWGMPREDVYKGLSKLLTWLNYTGRHDKGAMSYFSPFDIGREHR